MKSPKEEPDPTVSYMPRESSDRKMSVRTNNSSSFGDGVKWCFCPCVMKRHRQKSEQKIPHYDQEVFATKNSQKINECCVEGGASFPGDEIMLKEMKELQRQLEAEEELSDTDDEGIVLEWLPRIPAHLEEAVDGDSPHTETNRSPLGNPKFQHHLYPGKDHWFGESMEMIEKAIAVDNLQPLDNETRYSSSAVDFTSIMHSVQNLQWESYKCKRDIEKIVEDTCRCFQYYAEQLVKTGGFNSQRKDVQQFCKVCVVIANLDHVKQYLGVLVETLRLPEVARTLVDVRGGKQLKAFLQQVGAAFAQLGRVLAATVTSQVSAIAAKVSAEVQGVLILRERCSPSTSYISEEERLLKYLDESLIILYSQLTDKHLYRIMNSVWESLLPITKNILDRNRNKRKRTAVYYKQLHDGVEKMVGFLARADQRGKAEIVTAQLKDLLEPYTLETSELIYRYHMKRHDELASLDSNSQGILTIVPNLEGTSLSLQVLNIKGVCPDVASRPYVKLKFISNGQSKALSKHRTKPCKKNIPLVEDVFAIELTSEQWANPNILLHFMVKEERKVRNNKLLCVGYIHLSELPSMWSQQIDVRLGKPIVMGAELDIIKCRSDKVSKKFYKKYVEAYR